MVNYLVSAFVMPFTGHHEEEVYPWNIYSTITGLVKNACISGKIRIGGHFWSPLESYECV